MEPGLALQEFLQFVVGQLVTHPDRASVAHEETEDAKHVYHIHLDEEDIGKIIGRNGFTISAIRSLVKAAAQKHHVKALVKIEGSEH